MLYMDYYDRNGDKWSIENGDWLSHQANRQPVKNNYTKNSFKGVILFVLVIVVLVSCFISLI